MSNSHPASLPLSPPPLISTDPHRFFDRLYAVTLLDVAKSRKVGTDLDQRVIRALSLLFDREARVHASDVCWLEQLVTEHQAQHEAAQGGAR